MCAVHYSFVFDAEDYEQVYDLLEKYSHTGAECLVYRKGSPKRELRALFDVFPESIRSKLPPSCEITRIP